MVEEVVWTVQGLRSYIFSYLRTKAHSTCDSCSCVLQWDEIEGLRKPTHSYNGKTVCATCFRTMSMWTSWEYSIPYLEGMD